MFLRQRRMGSAALGKLTRGPWIHRTADRRRHLFHHSSAAAPQPQQPHHGCYLSEARQQSRDRAAEPGQQQRERATRASKHRGSGGVASAFAAVHDDGMVAGWLHRGRSKEGADTANGRQRTQSNAAAYVPVRHNDTGAGERSWQV